MWCWNPARDFVHARQAFCLLSYISCPSLYPALIPHPTHCPQAFAQLPPTPRIPPSLGSLPPLSTSNVLRSSRIPVPPSGVSSLLLPTKLSFGFLGMRTEA